MRALAGRRRRAPWPGGLRRRGPRFWCDSGELSGSAQLEQRHKRHSSSSAPPVPANLRALTAAAAPADRDWLEDQLARDRGGNYARALALLRSLDGTRNCREAAWWAAMSSELPVPAAFAERFFGLLQRAGWAVAAGEVAVTGGGGR